MKACFFFINFWILGIVWVKDYFPADSMCPNNLFYSLKVCRTSRFTFILHYWTCGFWKKVQWNRTIFTQWFFRNRGWHLNLTKVFEEFHCRFFSKVHLNTEKTYLVSAFSEQCVCEMSGTTSAYVKKWIVIKNSLRLINKFSSYRSNTS